MSIASTRQATDPLAAGLSTPALELKGVRKQFGKTEIIRGVDLQVQQG